MKDIAKGIVYTALFLVPFLPLYVENDWFFPFITGKNFGFRILVEIALAAWVLLAFYDKRYRPKFSWILVSTGSLLVVMFFANLLGEYPLKSFWSNFERMDGYVTLVHFFLYTLVLGSMLNTERFDFLGFKTNTWSIYIGTIFFVSLLVVFRALQQLAGVEVINQGGWRIDSTLGNASYMAVYMLFLAFLATLMAVKTKFTSWRVFYIGLVGLFVTLLLLTVTRGTAIGLVGGALVTAAYIALFETRLKKFRLAAVVIFATVAITASGLWLAKDTELVSENRITDRLTSISLKDLETRGTIWGMAWEGVKERPLLGWGQGNFNYVFNTYYEPSLYAQESWFDRVHNLVFDWLIAGGILGALAYFSILGSALYYLFWKSVIRKEESFTVVEAGILIGLLAGYVVHNLVVFDNIVSYIFYGTVLAYIHSRVATPVTNIEEAKVDTDVVNAVVAPTVGVAALLVLYFVNMPGILASGDLIDAFQTRTPDGMVRAFDSALDRGSFGDQEIREQLTQRAQPIFRSNEFNQEIKGQLASRIESELLQQIQEKPGDARLHVFISGFYRQTGLYDRARAQLETARTLSPNKQAIIMEQGIVEYETQNYEAAYNFFKEAYDLAPAFRDARNFYFGSLLVTDRIDEAHAILDELTDDEALVSVGRSQFVVAAGNLGEAWDILQRIFQLRISGDSENGQHYVSLAVVYVEQEKRDEAVAILEEANNVIPGFRDQVGNRYVENVQAGRNLDDDGDTDAVIEVNP